jgi:hypothetical protein
MHRHSAPSLSKSLSKRIHKSAIKYRRLYFLRAIVAEFSPVIFLQSADNGSDHYVPVATHAGWLSKKPVIRPLTFFPILTRIGLWMMLQAWFPALTQPKQFGCHHQLAVARLPTCIQTVSIEEVEQFRLSRRYLHRADTFNPCYQFPLNCYPKLS